MNWEAKLIKHKGQERIAVYFEKNEEWIARIKKQDGARWSIKRGRSSGKRQWYASIIPKTDRR